MKRVAGKPRKEEVDPWKAVFPPAILDRFDAQAYHPLSVEFKEMLRQDPKNGRAKLGLGLCYAGMGMSKEAIALLLQVKKEVPLHEAITRFLPFHYQSWMDLIDQLMGHNEVESAKQLSDCLINAWRPQKGQSLDRYLKLVKSVDWLHSHNNFFCRIWWYLTMAPLSVVTVVVMFAVLFIAAGIGTYMCKEQIAAHYLKGAKDTYFRGVLSLAHLQSSAKPPIPKKLAQMSKKQQIAALYPGDTSVPTDFARTAKKQLETVEKLSPGNVEAEFLSLKCDELLFQLETNEKQAKKLNEDIENAKKAFKDAPEKMQQSARLEKDYEEHKRALLQGERSQL